MRMHTADDRLSVVSNVSIEMHVTLRRQLYDNAWETNVTKYFSYKTIFEIKAYSKEVFGVHMSDRNEMRLHANLT